MSGERVVVGLAKVAHAMRLEAWEAGAEAGLSPTQAQALALLLGRPRGVSALAREMGVTKPTVSDAVAALARKGLVRRRAAGADARRSDLVPTAKGARAARAAQRWPEALMASIGELEAAERDAFARGLVKMVRSLQRAGRVPVSKMCATCVHFRPHAHPRGPRPHHCAYIDEPIGDSMIRYDCDDHEPLDEASSERVWKVFIRGREAAGASPEPRPAVRRERVR